LIETGSAETLESVDAPNPAETPNPEDADDSAASASIANMASTISFFFIIAHSPNFQFIFKSKAKDCKTGL
jgi:hypothetical protein